MRTFNRDFHLLINAGLPWAEAEKIARDTDAERARSTQTVTPRIALDRVPFISQG